MGELSFREAVAADLSRIVELLTQANLPLAGVEEHINDFVLAFHHGDLAGCGALERYGEYALLRSVAVAKNLRNSGVGGRLVTHLLDNARAAETKSLVLLTTTASTYFERFGFQTTSREEAPPPVHASAEFHGACPASATVMLLDLSENRRVMVQQEVRLP